jgi:hypothetical protein
MKAVYDALAWLCLSLMVVGFGGGIVLSAYLQWTTGFDAGFPFNIFAVHVGVTLS